MTHRKDSVSARAPATLRARHREGMRQAFLDAALRVVAEDGEHALSMKRVTKELECSVGTIYRYFRSKSDLVAAVHRERLKPLRASLRASEALAGEWLASSRPQAPTLAALAPLVAVGRAWVQAAETAPSDVGLARRLIVNAVDGDGEAKPPSDAERLVEQLLDLVDAATNARALVPGDADFRARMIVRVVTAPGLAPVDADVEIGVDGKELGLRLLDCLLATWGANANELAALAWAFGAAEIRRSG